MRPEFLFNTAQSNWIIYEFRVPVLAHTWKCWFWSRKSTSTASLQHATQLSSLLYLSRKDIAFLLSSPQTLAIRKSGRKKINYKESIDRARKKNFLFLNWACRFQHSKENETLWLRKGIHLPSKRIRKNERMVDRRGRKNKNLALCGRLTEQLYPFEYKYLAVRR